MAQEPLHDDTGQAADKGKSKAGAIVRKILFYVFMLALVSFFVLLAVKKCSGQL